MLWITHFKLSVCSSSIVYYPLWFIAEVKDRVAMQLIVNGSQTHVLEVSPEANVAQLRAQLSMLEGVDCEQVNIGDFHEKNVFNDT